MVEGQLKLPDLAAEDIDALFPRLGNRVRLHWHEVRSAIGAEGLKALGMYILSFAVLAIGLWVTLRTWGLAGRGLHIVTGSLNLAVVWLMFVVAVAVAGRLLADQVTKRWLRAFVGAGVLISILLLITLGRVARIDQAAADARAASRQLLKVESLKNGNASKAELSLLVIMCEKSGSEDCRKTLGDATVDRLGTPEARAPFELQCLEGWTVGGFEEWLRTASFDRQVAALDALTSCEVGAVNPVAEAAVQEPVAVTDTVSEQGGPEPSASPPPTPEAVAAVRDAVAVQRSELRVDAAIVRGADEILAFASGPTKFAEFRLSGIVWLVLLAAGLLWYRGLEIKAGARRLGPLDVQFDDLASASDGKGEGKGNGHGSEAKTGGGTARPPKNPVETIFKESVIRNIPEPGAIPGGEALAQVGDLVGRTDLPQKWLIGGVIEAAATILATRGGFTVVFGTRHSIDKTVVFVRLRDTRTGEHLASHIVQHTSEEEAAREAGYWIAGWIIHRSRYVPSWARWSEDDAKTFSKTFLGIATPGDSDTESGPQDIQLSDAHDHNSTNSIIRVQRAYRNQISSRSRVDSPGGGRHAPRNGGGNHLAALEDLARAVYQQPRYPVARYRRAAVLSTMMHLGGNLASASGGSVTGSTRARLQYLLSDLLLDDSLTVARPNDDEVSNWVDTLVDDGTDVPDDRHTLPDDMRTTMLRLVAEWVNRNRAELRWARLAMLRPSEKFFWKNFTRGRKQPGGRLGRHGNLRSDWMLMLDVGRCISAEHLRTDVWRRHNDGRQQTSAKQPAPTHANRQDVPRDQQQHGSSAPRRSRIVEPPRLMRKTARRQRRVNMRLQGLEHRASKRAQEPDSLWQLSYNLACYHSIRSALYALQSTEQGLESHEAKAAECKPANDEKEMALVWLERCLDRPASHQLIREWVAVDGDLNPLHGDEFTQWQNRVPARSGERR